MRTLRAGLVGLGSMGKNHARILSGLTGVDFVGIVDPLVDEFIDRKYHDVLKFKVVSELLKLDLDYCVISVPTNLHAEVALEVLSKNVNCLIEKPVALDVLQANKIRDIANSSSLIVGIGHVERYNSAIQELKRRLEAHELGEIFHISLLRQGPYPSRISDVGVIKDLTTHDIDIVSWITGSKFQKLFAQSHHSAGRVHEDLVSVNGRLMNGILFNLDTSWVSPLKKRMIRIVGANGMFEVDILESELTFYENGIHNVSQDSLQHLKGERVGTVLKYAFEKREPLIVEHEKFRDRIFGLNSEIVTLDEGIEVLRIAEGILKSSSQDEVFEC